MRPDVIYAVGQPWTALLAGWALRLAYGTPLVVDFMDPWASRARAWDRHKPAFVQKVAAVLERAVVRRAAWVVANTTELADDLIDRLGLARDRVTVIPCGFDADDFAHPQERVPTGTFVITHTGSLYGRRNPANFLEAVRRLVQAGRIAPGRIRVDFVGKLSISDPRLQAILTDPTMQDIIRFEPWLPHATALERLAASDLLLILQPDLRLAIPAKLYEYAAVGRPILALADLDSAVARIVADERWGQTVANDDIESMVRILDALVHDEHPQQQPDPARLSNYRMDVLAGRLADVLRSASRRNLGPIVETS